MENELNKRVNEEKTINIGSNQLSPGRLGPKWRLPSPGIIAKLERILNRRNIIIILVIVAVLAGIWALRTYVFKPKPKKLYDVAIMVRSQQNSDLAEDARTSLKKGDVLVIRPDGHKWSNTERVSYLMLKMELTEEQAQKLTQAEERELDEDELSAEERTRIDEEKKRAKEEGREYMEEPQRETLRAREYYIPLDQKEFAGFAALDLMNGQPFQEKVYGWEVVKRKESLK